MAFNAFEGARRISILASLAAIVGTGIALYEQSPNVWVAFHAIDGEAVGPALFDI